MLAQVWGLGFGVGLAHASSATPPSGPTGAAGRAVRSIGVPNTNDAGSGALGVAGEATGASSGATSAAAPGTVDQLLHNRIKAGGLPLPGQATALPDAFSIAAVLLPAVPPQPGAPAVAGPGGEAAVGSRAAHGGAFPVQHGRAEGDGADAAAPAAWAPGTGWDRGAPAARGAADGASDRSPVVALNARTAGTAASRDGERPLVGLPRPLADGGSEAVRSAGEPVPPDPNQQPVTVAPAASAQASGMETAVLFPIAAGLLLTGAAMYKHRGLPRGH
ncbi:hypothetical protein ACFW1A_21785 [Kitasatospora sp. NPDC058965]|uniref:hypothetical protein n=1 Tax=Kitasatospora sp. NPDC058965 TaxID=3346682 RepID=UPI0036B57E8A